jgi:hypothetical protein
VLKILFSSSVFTHGLSNQTFLSKLGNKKLRFVATYSFNFLPNAISILNGKISNENAMDCSAAGTENACVFRLCNSALKGSKW